MSTDNDQSPAPEESAFNSASAGVEVGKEALLPFSPVRERAAQAMGMRAPAWKPEDFTAIQAGTVYPGGLRDATIFVWLCSTPTAAEQDTENLEEKSTAKCEGRKPVFKSGWTVQKAERNPEDAYEEACRFCEDKGILMGSNKFMEAYQAMITKGVDIINSRFTIEGGSSSGEAEPGNV